MSKMNDDGVEQSKSRHVEGCFSIPGKGIVLLQGGDSIVKTVIDMVVRAAIIVGLWGAIGLGVNLVSPHGIPWIYVQAKAVELHGTKVALIDEKEARNHFGNGEGVFVDTRSREDYDKGHFSVVRLWPSGRLRLSGVQGL